MNEDLNNTIESVLFSAARRIDVQELAKVCKERDIEKIKNALQQLKQDLEQKNSSLLLVNEGDFWKLTVREKYMAVVSKIVTKTELPKSIMETLAVVAYKSPVLQSNVIKVRTNKAYDHLNQLEEANYITREKKGRTKLIKLSQRFFEYFDLPPEKLKEHFKEVQRKENEVAKLENPFLKEIDTPEYYKEVLGELPGIN
ncbi:MAG: SMC-Scp complex subunit ScpB [Nanoarchaeota archaeon]